MLQYVRCVNLCVCLRFFRKVNTVLKFFIYKQLYDLIARVISERVTRHTYVSRIMQREESSAMQILLSQSDLHGRCTNCVKCQSLFHYTLFRHIKRKEKMLSWTGDMFFHIQLPKAYAVAGENLRLTSLRTIIISSDLRLIFHIFETHSY